ncbi:hypothetical protein [Microbacterium sp.]|uniref:hypothetical protein n=1 Tax=Microbacterium sp. TaxID=51671 RepID=UPI0028122360|nr:hypothetical protein [Microbacterium sp.]
MTTITHTTGTLTPVVVDGWRAARPARTVVHEILGRTDPDVTFRPAGLRRGTLRLVFPAEADAAHAVQVLATPQRLTLTDPDRATLAMAFVVPSDGGDIECELDDATRNVWIVSCPFQEVTA